MPLWPFGRKQRRTSTTQSLAYEEQSEKAIETGERNSLTSPINASKQPVPRRDSQRERNKVRRASEQAPSTAEKPPRTPVRRGSDQGITALPGMKELESSPHLRPANMSKPVIPYNLDRGSPIRTGISSPGNERMTPSPTLHSRQTGRTSTPQRRRSGRKRDQSLREEEIRAMSAPMYIPKRPAGVNNDLLRRDSKKARRTLSSKRPEDSRGSNVSLPLEHSIHPSMSEHYDRRGWEVSVMSVFSPRPTVRLSGPGFYPPSRNGNAAKLSRKSSRKETPPEVAEDSTTKDRQRIAHLADDLDASELRAVMDRDRRRREQKDREQHERLDRKLRRRAEKQRAEEERRTREEQRTIPPPPTAVHPALRAQDVKNEDVAGEVLTPMSTKEAEESEADGHEERGRSPRGGTYLKYAADESIPQGKNPFNDPEPSPFADPDPDPETDAASTSPLERTYSTLETPMEEAVVETARAVRLSQGHMSPPTSPIQSGQATPTIPQVSRVQHQRTPSVPIRPFSQDQRRVSDASARRTGTWASLFRRGPSISSASEERVGRSMPSESSFVNASRESAFSNTSRESMSRQSIPAHLVQQAPSHRSGTPVRTQSRFREDLPELPMSPPDSRVQSPELPIVTGNVAIARRGKRTTQPGDGKSAHGGSIDATAIHRTDSPVITDGRTSITVLSQSLASVDSEASWLGGRAGQKDSNQSQSAVKPVEEFSASYDRLPVPDHEFFSALTPQVENSRRSDGETTQPAQHDPILGEPSTDDGTPLRQGTAHRRRPTVVHNEARHKSREGLLAEYEAGEMMTASRQSSQSEYSTEDLPIEQRARSVNYGLGHVKSLSAGSAKLLNIQPSKSKSGRPSPASVSPARPSNEPTHE